MQVWHPHLVSFNMSMAHTTPTTSSFNTSTAHTAPTYHPHHLLQAPTAPTSSINASVASTTPTTFNTSTVSPTLVSFNVSLTPLPPPLPSTRAAAGVPSKWHIIFIPYLICSYKMYLHMNKFSLF
ncbi:hypothetical protein BDQ12DRAFT_682673 [Crucibulum laeve]|uniref:Uncharacterized protein n=1 Tax=Crucibulum laeve TaxID=68775 RepID=A0A5C3M1P1_9AGAR|nr:hypothetical protein BDQ12DRAFT_682673 [Crucibulum laeve]